MPVGADSHSAPDGRPLVLDGQRSLTPPLRGWCENGPEELRYLVGTRYVRPRCKRRDCPRCWSIRSRETARCLLRDAEQDAPAYALTLTTEQPWQELDPATYREGSRMVFQRLRRRYGRVEFFGAIEFSTGLAVTSGGHRRLHGHYLVKGELDVLDAGRLVRETWEAVTGAWRIEVSKLRTAGAALGYVGLHHRKPSQAPPAIWRGMTERASKKYWHRPIAELREQARSELRAEAHAWRTGMSVELAALELAAEPPAKLRAVRTRPGRQLLDPQGAPSWVS